MSFFTVQLISQGSTGDDEDVSLEHALEHHVHKYVDRFILKSSLKDTTVPLVLIQNENVSSKKNVAIFDRSWMLPANAEKNVSLKSSSIRFYSKSFTTPYKDVLVTDVFVEDANGKKRPIYFKHKFTKQVVECNTSFVLSPGFELPAKDVLLSVEDNTFYTNYRNYISDSGNQYMLVFLNVVYDDNTSEQVLLNAVPAVEEATWEDIDLVTGALKTNYSTYSKTESLNTYTLNFSRAKEYWVKPLKDSTLFLKKPSSSSLKEPWFLRVNNGSLSALSNGEVKKYSITEYDTQGFAPYKPYRFLPYQSFTKVLANTYQIDNKNFYINPSQNFHLTLEVFDKSGILIKVFSTNPVLSNTYYLNSNILVETDKILTWDNQHGIVVLNNALSEEWVLKGTCFFEAKDFVLTNVDFNPFTNKEIFGKNYVFYLIPNLPLGEQSIHYIATDSFGKIIFCSQSTSAYYPNLSLLNEDGTYNNSTVVGKKYFSETDSSNFLELFATGFDNTFGYLILGEVNFNNSYLLSSQKIVDLLGIRNPIKEHLLHDVAVKYPKVAHSAYVYGENGLEYPSDGVSIIKIPIEILSEYGGYLDQTAAEKYLTTHYPAYGAVIFELDYLESQVDAISIDTEEVVINYTFEAPSATYKIYRRKSESDVWVLIHTNTNPSSMSLSYTDTDVISGELCYYCVEITANGLVHPKSHSVCVKVY